MSCLRSDLNFFSRISPSSNVGLVYFTSNPLVKTRKVRQNLQNNWRYYRPLRQRDLEESKLQKEQKLKTVIRTFAATFPFADSKGRWAQELSRGFDHLRNGHTEKSSGCNKGGKEPW